MFKTFTLGSNVNIGSWVDLYAPIPMRPYIRLMRLDRPTGIWLLFWPCLWGLALASHGVPNIWMMILFALGSIVMRGAGCVVNDIYDRNLDKMVERTCLRPLANGDIQMWQALVFLIILLMLGLIILLQFNTPTILIGASSLILVFTYPLMKRITWWPQFFLGLTFNIGCLMGSTAVTSHISVGSLLLYGSGLFWTLGYDTIYAFQDLRDDALAGIKSTAQVLTKNAVAGVGGFYGGCFTLLLLSGWCQNQGWGFYGLTAILAGLTCYQLGAWRWQDPADCLKRFVNNHYFGLIVFIALLCGKWF